MKDGVTMANNGYNTRARKYILEFLNQRETTTVSVNDILEYLTENGITVNFTTVYRYLNKLTDDEKVIKFVGKDGSQAVYKIAESEKTCHNHLHVQCTKCGRLIHLDCDFMEELREHLSKDHGFCLECSGSVLYGICNACKK